MQSEVLVETTPQQNFSGHSTRLDREFRDIHEKLGNGVAEEG